jgi:NDP-sugar pyrophosphorylase family protein
VTGIGGDAGDAVTAGIYVFPERVRKLSAPAALGRLREYLAWLVERGETVRALTIEEVVDVDRSEDIRLAEALAARRSSGLAPGVPGP